MFQINHIFRHGLVVVAIGLCLLAISLAMRWGSADLYHLKARQYMFRWAQATPWNTPASAEIDPRELNEALAAATTATRLHPRHPDYWSLLGQIHEWRAYHMENGKEERRRAAAAYQQAITLRPLWPEIRISQALNRWHQGKVDERLWALLHSADHTGPFNTRVNTGIANAGLALWHQLPEDSRQLVLRHINRGLKNPLSRLHIRELAHQHQQQHLLCLVIRTQMKKSHPTRQYCRKKSLAKKDL